MKLIVIFVILIAKVNKINGQYLWYKFVDCQNTPNGLECYDVIPKSVVTPFNHQQNYNVNTMPLSTNHAVANQRPQMHPSTSTSFARSRDPLKDCSDDEFKCTSLHQCIGKEKACDGHVNCVDGTDEENCSCRSRLDPRKICDNYVDCPDGDDEMECNGCDRDSYSCYSDVQNECYSKSQKCNFFAHCSNEEDEKNCLLLLPESNSIINPYVRHTKGILFRNFENIWYPVCNDYSNTYAQEVCQEELGVQLSVELINITHIPTTYDGKYLSRMVDSRIKFVNKCLKNDMESTNHHIHVKCPHDCGSITASNNRARIAGGKDALGESHPWIVGLYLNGTFVCAGSIFKRTSVLTAAHCVHHNGIRLTKYDYLEVRAGFIRQRSFSPYEQIIVVKRIVIHPDYSAVRYKNDIAVLQLSEPFFYNRWVKPICLQSMSRIGDGTDPNWMWKPDVNSICSTAGWGGFTDRGPAPVENLNELELPILSNCVVDNPINVTCAGYPNGGADTCSGDSGGPLECRSHPNLNEFYLAGIISTAYNPKKNEHSRLFCGEPDTVTAFTKTSFYLDWIKNATLEHGDDIWPAQRCPLFTCRTNNRCVKPYNGIVDCIHGEDEIKRF